MSGSSPLARGLRGCAPYGSLARRIIPARAGFTLSRYQREGPGAGSSPLARGLRRPAPALRTRGRIIPARAGFTGERRHDRAAFQDHPRSRGVYGFVYSSLKAAGGSSPLALGLHPPRRRGPGGRGIIPARAGFTSDRPHRVTRVQDHPRSRGVYGVA